MRWNWWYLVLVGFMVGAAILGYYRTHPLKLKYTIQPRIERFGLWVCVDYAFWASVMLMTLVILESVSGVMQIVTWFFGEDWDFLLALAVITVFSASFGWVLVLISKFFGELGRKLYVTGEILIPKRGSLRLYNRATAVPRGARQYWMKGDLSLEAVRQLLVMDTACQDSAARDHFVAKLYGELSEHERKILDAVMECMAENAHKEECRCRAVAAVEEIKRKNLPRNTPNVGGSMSMSTVPETTPVPKPQNYPQTNPEKANETEQEPTATKRTESRPSSIKGLTPVQTEMLTCCLEDTPELADLLSKSEVVFENMGAVQDVLTDSLMKLANLLRSKAAFFKPGTCGLRFIITESGSVMVKSPRSMMTGG